MAQVHSEAAGPLRHATLIVSDLPAMVSAYASLGLRPGATGSISKQVAADWGQPQLAGRIMLELAPQAGGPSLLRMIEIPGAPARPTRQTHGWMALEILVRDVDALAATLPANGFEVVGPPADLDVSPNIRAMQLIGPAGEMLYLTQVKAPVPPFSIPQSCDLPANADLGQLFIAVMSAPSRQAAVLACEGLKPLAALHFDTKITVLNRALGHPVDKRWPVATLQFEASCLFEIDEVIDAQVGTAPRGALPQGLAWITIQTPNGNAAMRGLKEISPGAWLECVPAP